ncbi:MAG: ABC transporter ATP-binding protein, partial [Rhodospirillales bacterium]|nr:ABC transporter ATP-binding protein [Rhodospirillales bacterium]
LLEEPLSALDLKLRKEMQIELKRLQNETGITFVFVTHDQEEALTMSDRVAVMNAGNILQIGAPRTIYDHPSERFVAHFIGETNFVEAELIEIDGRNGRVQLPSGAEVPASLPDVDLSPGKVTVVIRPEHVDLVPDAGVLQGTIDNVVYFGTDTHYHLHLDDGTPFVARLQNQRDSAAAFTEGDKAGITVKDNAIQVLVD